MHCGCSVVFHCSFLACVGQSCEVKLTHICYLPPPSFVELYTSVSEQCSEVVATSQALPVLLTHVASSNRNRVTLEKAKAALRVLGNLAKVRTYILMYVHCCRAHALVHTQNCVPLYHCTPLHSVLPSPPHSSSGPPPVLWWSPTRTLCLC